MCLDVFNFLEGAIDDKNKINRPFVFNHSFAMRLSESDANRVNNFNKNKIVKGTKFVY